jgi:CDP-4-dehydro-6-deoxyglucose reductase
MSSSLRTALVGRTPVADGVVDFSFALVEPSRLDFRGGQFVTLNVGKDAQGRELRRSYSIASRADRGETLRLLLRLVPGGPGSEFFAHLHPGGEVAMTGPHGFFILDDQHPGDVVFGATGTGIAPILPMLAEMAARGPTAPRTIDVYWGVRHQRDLFVEDEVRAACAAAGARLRIHLSQPDPGWTGGTGRITQAILHDLPSFHAPIFYLVGNGAMITELKKELVARGVERKKQIRTEAFFD